MLHITFICDACGFTSEYNNLREGYELPVFNNLDLCRSCLLGFKIDFIKKVRKIQADKKKAQTKSKYD